jgi:hypothetical protein
MSVPRPAMSVQLERKTTPFRPITFSREAPRQTAVTLELIFNNGDVRRLWIDETTFLEAQIDGQPVRLRGKSLQVHTTFKDFRSVQGGDVPISTGNHPRRQPEDEKNDRGTRRSEPQTGRLQIREIAVDSISERFEIGLRRSTTTGLRRHTLPRTPPSCQLQVSSGFRQLRPQRLLHL